MMKFIVAYRHSTPITFECAPRTNEEHVQALMNAKRKVDEKDMDLALSDPFGISHIGTLNHAKRVFPDATVVFA